MTDLAIGESVVEEWRCTACGGVGKERYRVTRISQHEYEEVPLAPHDKPESDGSQMGLFGDEGEP